MFNRYSSRLPLRHLSIFLCLIILCAGLLPTHAYGATDANDLLLGLHADERNLNTESVPTIDATYAAVLDEKGTLLFDRRATESAQIASLTKIMTALVAAEYLNANTNITISPTAARIGEANAGLTQGDTMPFDAALKALLTASGNNVATAIAEVAGMAILNEQGNNAPAYEAAFIETMNTKAQELGLVNSYFTNPHGLDFDEFSQGQYSCAQDIATILREAMKVEIIRQSIGFSQVDIVVMRQNVPTTISLANTDILLESYDGACAAKTGFTLAAGPCLATAVNREDGYEYYTVVLNSSSKSARFSDSITLYDLVYANRELLEQADKQRLLEEEEALKRARYDTYQLFTSSESIQSTINGSVGTFPVVAYVSHDAWINTRVAATVREPNKALEIVQEDGPLTQEVTYLPLVDSVAPEEVVGHLSFLQGETIMWETDLIAAEQVDSPSWLDSALIAAQRFMGGFFGWPRAAQSEFINPAPLKIS